MSTPLETSSGDPVSQRDIARHFGVSHVTVSLALRHNKRISKCLADEIRAFAESVGYRRDPVLHALADYRRRKSCTAVRGAIAWINAWKQPASLRAYPEVERYWRGASAAALECGYRLEEFRLGSELTPERLHQVLVTRNIRCILLPPHDPSTDWRGFPWEDYAMVSFGHSDRVPKCDHVMPGTAANLALALREIHERGYQRVGCLIGGSILRRAGDRMEDYLPAARRIGATGEEPPLLVLEGMAETTAAAPLRDWIRGHRLDAILADDAAAGRWILKAGFSIPGDVAFATLARTSEAGVDPGSEEIGRAGIQMLDELMRQRRPASSARLTRQVAVDGTWVDGPSLPRAAARQFA